MRIEEQPAWDRPVPAEEAEENAGPVYVSVQDAEWEHYAPRLHFASAEIDPTLVPAFLAPAPAAVGSVTAGGPVGGRRRRRRSRTGDHKPRG